MGTSSILDPEQKPLLLLSEEELIEHVDKCGGAEARRRVMAARSRRPGSRQPELWTWLDSVICIKFAQQPASRDSWLVRWAPSSYERYSRALRRLTAAQPDPTLWSPEFLAQQVQDQIVRAAGAHPSAVGRPLGAVDQMFAAVIAFFKIIERRPQWAESRESAANVKALMRAPAINAQARTPANRPPPIDFDKIIASFIKKFDHINTTDALLSIQLQDLREIALALFAMHNPTRGRELVGAMTMQGMSIAPEATGVRTPLSTWLPRALDDINVLRTQLQKPFVLFLECVDTKGDRKKKGEEKSIHHHPDAAISPAAALLALMFRRVAMTGLSPSEVYKALTDKGIRWFPFALVDAELTFWPNPKLLSRTFSQVAENYAGVPNAGFRAWRSSAVIWLSKCGIDMTEIQKRGCWYRIETTVAHYLRNKDLSRDTLMRMFGAAKDISG